MRKLLVFVFAIVGLYSYSQSICGGSSATLQAPNPQNLTGPNYSLNPGGFSSIGGTFVVSPPVTTTYTLYTTGQNTNNVSVTTSVVTQVTVNAQPNTIMTFTQASCTNSFNAVNLGLTFNPSSPSPAYTISWTPLPASVLSPQQFTATNLTAGPYTVAITAASGCATTVHFTITPQPAPATFSVIPFGSTHSITCTQPTVQLSATNANHTYTWSGASFTSVVGQSITLTSLNLGTLSVTGQNTVSGCVNTYTFMLGQNISVPSSTLSTSLINITCSQSVAPTLSVIASPSVNVTHNIYSPQGGTFSATSYTTIYYPGGPGTYTHVLVNDVNGCSVTKFFTVTTSDNYPTYTVTSALNNFTLGCNARATASISIDNAATTPTPGGPVSYTIIGPGTSTTIPSGTLSTVSVYSINVPGTWTVIVKDNTNNCETRNLISILQNTFTPLISANVPLLWLDCDNPKMVLEGVSETPNISYNWGFGGSSPGNVAGSTITVNTNTSAATSTLVNTYTLTITDLSSTCKSTSIIPVYQNIYAPISQISAGGTSLTCITPTIVLTNQSRTGIPLAAPFPTNQNVIAYLWEGPTPQMPLQVNTTYTAGTVGIYTLTSKDLNNGCFAKSNFTITDAKVYPTINPPPTVATPSVIDCGAASVLLVPVITGSNLTYTWTAPSATSIIGGNSAASLSVKFPGVYTVTAKNNNNGCVMSGTMSAVNGSLTAAFVADQDNGYAPLPVVFTNNSSSSNGTSSITTAWSFGNGTSFTTSPTTAAAPSATYSQPGTYHVAMFVTKGSCLDTAYLSINVEIPSAVVVPNVFTPNGDGSNDIFFLRAKNLTEVSMTIYDRWGHVVYDVISTSGNIDWDGKNGQGKDSAEGTYFYVLKTTGKDGIMRDQKGTISLYR